jgi:ACS family tartrate transporter-like MFS transporter
MISRSNPENGKVDGAATIAKVTRRIAPFLIACFFAAYLDRVNIGFAALTMNRELGFSPQVFGLGAGIFFVGYCLLEAPSNYILHRVGARLWIARIMVSWGFISALTSLVWNETSFLTLRLVLGAAEAGFAPGVILYLTYWIPAEHRGRSLGAFLVAIPLSTVIGAPLSGLTLTSLDGALGVSGWRWLFIVEAIPTILLGIAAFFFLTDRPGDASWLTTQERDWLQDTLESERAEYGGEPTVGQTLRDPRVLGLGIVYFGVVAALYGLGFWLPQLVGDFGFGPALTGVVTAIPYACGAVAMIFWSRSSDRSGERARHTAAAAALAAANIAPAACVKSPALSIAAFSLASIGTLAAMPPFWALPTNFLSGASAAVGIAVINSIGNVAGFAGPYLVGWLKGDGEGYSTALLALACGPLMSALLVLWIAREVQPGPRMIDARASSPN